MLYVELSGLNGVTTQLFETTFSAISFFLQKKMQTFIATKKGTLNREDSD